MAVFSRSVFQSVLDRLEAEAPDDVPEEGQPHRPRGLNSGLAFDVGQSSGPGMPVADAYAAYAPEAKPEPSPKSMPAHLGRLDDEAVVADLGISETDTFQHLVARRREFARHNHPDLVDPEFADNATIRMKIANRLIDEALKKLRAGSRA
jgi:hypothetical protein